MSETIYSLSSGIGRAGIAVIRVSGSSAIEAARGLAGLELTPRMAALAYIRHPLTRDVIDQALLLWFPGPNSFTGEDVVEFHIHGGRAVVAATLDALSSFENMRAAEPGEFTRRAFANRKLDLTSVEGLSDLILADTELQRRQAIGQFSGSVGELGRSWRKALIEAQALIEAHLDFPDEGEIPVDVTDDVRQDLTQLMRSFEQALASRQRAEIVRDGAVVLIAGPPNSGKSTLLNRIAARDVAIISEIPGTTRDLIEITVDLGGIPVTFIDSAGIRETIDPIEKQGIARTRARADQAHLVLWLTSASEQLREPELVHPQLKIILTKLDLTDLPETDLPDAGLGVSAATGYGMRELLDFVYESVVPSIEAEPSALASHRQFECVYGAMDATDRAIDRLFSLELELVAEELRLASRRIEELIGGISTDDLLDEIFGRFCLGK